MRLAISEASIAAQLDEVPVGAIIVRLDDNRVVGRGHNQVENKKNCTQHAEILAINQATNFIGNWRLENCALVVTLEPCTMCIGAIRLARIPVLIFGADEPKTGACGSIYDLSTNNSWGAQPPRVIRGVLKEECQVLLSDFFKKLR